MKSRHEITAEYLPNPVSLRIWFPRLVEDESFSTLLENLKSIRAERVYLMDNGYMDNFQLSPETLAERSLILKKRIAALHEAGIIAGINSGATIGHGGNMLGAERLMDLNWWVDADGTELVGIACPMGEKFAAWLEEYFKCLAQTGAKEIFIDDDMRLHGHSLSSTRDWGCFCDLHGSALNKLSGCNLSREELVEEIGQFRPGRVQKDWISLWKRNFLDMLRTIESAVHGVDAGICLGLMPVQNFIRDFGEDFLRAAIDIVSKDHRPLLRTHDYHGLPHDIVVGSGLAAKRTAPSNSEHLVEIENAQHNCHDFHRSPKTTRFAILTALATGMGGSAPTFGDSQQNMTWEQKYLNMYRDSDAYFRTVARLVGEGTLMRGVPVRNRAYQRKVEYIDTPTNVWDDARNEQPDVLAGVLGFSYEFEETCPALLLGELPRTMTSNEIRATLTRGAVIDVDALRCLCRLGYGDELGVTVGDTIEYRRGHKFLDHPLNAEYAGQINALRSVFPTYWLHADVDAFEEVTEFVSWTGQRVAGGVLIQKNGKGRNVILPHTLTMKEYSWTGITGIQYRQLIKRALEYVLGSPLMLSVDGPPKIAPFYFQRPSDEAVIITLLNGYYDDVYDFDLVLGNGYRMLGSTVCRVTPDGKLTPCPTLHVERIADSYRLRIDKDNALLNCDVLVLQIGGNWQC